MILTGGKDDESTVMPVAVCQHVSRVMKHGHPVHLIGTKFWQVGDSQRDAQRLRKLGKTFRRRNLDACHVRGVTPVGVQTTTHGCRPVGEGDC